ncbi:MAG TPA: phage holin family protein [Candidatus Faecaligallichristensenella faecipullorum]|nr:phage holin family protein [Candidatus Faecaligallichristensenella faecipullorum]
MDRVYNWLGALAGMAVGLMGGWDAAMKVLTVCMALDYITGVLSAIKEKKLSSSVGFWGLLRKGVIFLVVMLAAQLDAALGQEAVCRTAAILFYIANEAVSMTENAAKLGVPVPGKILDVLEQLKSK